MVKILHFKPYSTNEPMPLQKTINEILDASTPDKLSEVVESVILSNEKHFPFKYKNVRFFWSFDEASQPFTWPGPLTSDDLDFLIELDETFKTTKKDGKIFFSWQLPKKIKTTEDILVQISVELDDDCDVGEVEKWWGRNKNDMLWQVIGNHFCHLVDYIHFKQIEMQGQISEKKCQMMIRLSDGIGKASSLDYFLESLWKIASHDFNVSAINWWHGGEESRVIVDESGVNTLFEVRPNLLEIDCAKVQMVTQYPSTKIKPKKPLVWRVCIPIFSEKNHELIGILTLARPLDKFMAHECEAFEFIAYYLSRCMMHWTVAEKLELMVTHRTRALQDTVNALVRESDGKRRNEKLQNCLFQVADLASDINHWPNFYNRVHEILMTITNLKNLYIALVDKNKTMIKFPYYCDEKITSRKNQEYRSGLNEYIINIASPKFFSRKNIEEMLEKKIIDDSSFGEEIPTSWIGVPMMEDGEVFGIIVGQAYENSYFYNAKDLESLTLISQQVSHAYIKNRSLELLHDANTMLEARVEARTQELEMEARERERVQKLLYHEANHDSLTGLPNRKYLKDYLDGVLKEEGNCALLFLDIDSFKQINDSMGHGVGDDVLKIFGGRLKNNVRPNDFVARLSGDEFVVVMNSDVDEKSVVALADRLFKTISPTFFVNDSSIDVSCSLGWFLYKKSNTSSAATSDTLLRNADLALYKAKRRGRNRIERFSVEDENEVFEQTFLEGELKEAIENENFEAALEPIVCLKNGEYLGYEALARWKHEERGIISPMNFIPFAEKNSMLEKIDWLVYKKAFSWAEKNLKDGQFISINAGVKHFNRFDFPEKMERMVNKFNLKPSQIHIELNESALFEATEDILLTFDTLKEMGFHIAIDDFGTGFSSLSYLLRFPIDSIKIDQSFVRGLSGKKQKHSDEVISAILTMGKALDIGVVAEGVCDEATNERMKKLGCGAGQGYFYPDIKPWEDD